MIHRLFPTAGDVVAVMAWLVLVGLATVGRVRHVRDQRRRAGRYPVADRYARHRPRR